MIEYLILTLFMGIPATYVLKCLILEQKISHEGPFTSRTKQVVFTALIKGPQNDSEIVFGSHRQQVALFDCLRRPFGVYKVVGNEWIVDYDHWYYEIFTCPHCLSFWISFLFSIPLTYFSFGSTWQSLVWFVPTHLAIAIVSQIVYGVIYGED